MKLLSATQSQWSNGIVTARTAQMVVAGSTWRGSKWTKYWFVLQYLVLLHALYILLFVVLMDYNISYAYLNNYAQYSSKVAIRYVRLDITSNQYDHGML